jgi:cobalt/nickel transport system permease protein
VLGLWPAVLVMAAVVTIQAVFFADGGITALGANMLTMAVVGPRVGIGVYRHATGIPRARTARVAASFAAAWTSCVSAALVAAVLLWISGRVPLGAGLVAMGGWHALIGIGEGAITAGLIGYLLAVRPDLVAGGTPASGPAPARVPRAVPWVLGALALVAAGISFVASGSPDGLEYAYEHVGTAFDEITLLSSPMPDYLMPGIGNETLAGILAGIVGVIVTGVLAYALLSALRTRRAAQREQAE